MESRNLKLVEAFREKTKDFLSKIEDSVKNELDRYSDSSLYGPMMYALQDGKRIRPLVVLLSAEAVGTAKEDPFIGAVAIELLHTESIIHDDIIDQDTSRRGKTSFHVKYGYNASVLTADFVFGMILNIASRYRDQRIALELSNAALRMCEGEFREMKIDPNTYTMNKDEYISLLSHKTASLFETAAKIGGILGNGDEREVEELTKYGLDLGLAYQIQDDILDIGDGSKITASLKLNPENEDIQTHLTKLAQHFAMQARSRLSKLKVTEARDLLMELCDFTVQRPF